ncbi:MAG: D-cysteine desulfhydrase family protein, partial [Deltaproteobacteria bacterium]|nr:D-cysteine desulfhydrase family protein [Deltaproteobacteria bacterium]
GNIPRIKLTELPTPLEEMPRLSKALGGPRLLVKRDDLTGAGQGGNKVRKLEFLLADALKKGATTVITTGGPQTNHGRITIGAAAKLGLKSALVVIGAEPPARSGNLLLDYLMGAELHFVPSVTDESLSSYDRWKTDMDNVENKVEAVAEDLRSKGETPYIIKLGGTEPLGSLGYLDASVEILHQLNSRRIKADYLVCGVGTGGTFTGLLLGMKLLNSNMKVIGVSVTAKDYMLQPLVMYESSEIADLLKIKTELKEEEISIYDQYLGTAYGHPTEAGAEAIKLTARCEGLILDPVYTGKVMSGIIDLTKQGKLTSDDTVVFLHSGGVPGLFADEQVAAIKDYL